MPDVVALEATRLPEKPWAQEIAMWLAASIVEVVETETGVLYRLALDQGLKPPRHAGELSIIEWLRDSLPQHGTAFVIYEDARIPKMVAQEDFAAEVAVLTTHSFLELAEERGFIPSADQAWHAIEAAAPTVRQASVRMIRKPRP